MIRDPVCLMVVHPGNAAGMLEYEGRSYYFCSKACRNKFIQRPQKFIENTPGMRITVGVMGSADTEHTDAIRERVFAMGQAIAKRGLVLVTGACPGLPYDCAMGAKKAGGLSVGTSPALSLDEHVHKYHSPPDAFDVLIYTGSGLMGREVTNIRSSDMVIIVGGRSGTLGEFAIAYDEGKLIGVLKGSGGITDLIPDLVASFGKNTGAYIVYATDPNSLVAQLLSRYETHHFRRPSCFCDERPASG